MMKLKSLLTNTRQNKKRSLLRANWENLVFINYEVDSSLLEPYLPSGNKLDLWNGRCYLSLVAFQFRNTRIFQIPVYGWRNFDEINLRFYVKRFGYESSKSGVVFIKEIVPSYLVSKLANWLYGENYERKKMNSNIRGNTPSVKNVKFEFEDSSNLNTISALVDAKASSPQVNSFESYITEHYWGYASKGGDLTTEYEVEHSVWPVTEVSEYRVKVDFGSVYGEDFSTLTEQHPHSVFFCRGSSVIVRLGHKIKS